MNSSVSNSTFNRAPLPVSLPRSLRTYTAWRFDGVLPGTFKRNKAQFAHHDYPVLGPLPTAGRNTPAQERAMSAGPFLYFVCDSQERVRYVGKSLEQHVLQRWIRPGRGGPAKHYWTHSTASGGCVFNIASGLKSGESSHYTLRYVPVSDVGPELLATMGLSSADDLGRVERAFMTALGADWNRA